MSIVDDEFSEEWIRTLCFSSRYLRYGVTDCYFLQIVANIACVSF